MPQPDLTPRLQSALGDAYRIDRELPGGGMSRLFLGTERSLNRQVVIKVLPPEMTSEVSATRFKQEMEIAARLQHPHVLPVLAAGAKDDLLYYVMPYVAGESLRHRLTAQGALPVAAAVDIMRDVADALTAAHTAGILHRDIKPENILLESGHAVLTDFGIARAVEQSRAGQLTGTGLAMGTPAYMAPEQLAAEPDLDGRADVYSLALVGYEMLTGKLPFTATSGRASLAAQLTQEPPPLESLRADTPPAVSTAIARALAKDPRQRFATAQEFHDALDAAVRTPSAVVSSPRAMLTRRTLAIAALVVTAAVVAGWFALHRPRTAPVLDANVIAIAPFDVLDPALTLWHEGMVDVLSRNLDGAGPLRTITPTVIVRQWTGRADRVAAQQLGENTGARYAVFGTLLRTGTDSVRVSASLLDVGSGQVIADVQRSDRSDRMDRLSDTLTVALIRELGRVKELGPLQLSSVGTQSLPALKAFLQGEQFLRHSAFDSAVANFNRAIAFDSTFALAYRGVAQALGWEGSDDPRAQASRVLAARYNRGLAPRDSILIAADSLWVAITMGGAGQINVDNRLFGMLRDGTKRYPDDPEMWYELGDALFHFGGGSSRPTTPQEILGYFDRAIAVDSAYTPAYIHAVQLGYYLGGTATGRKYAAAYLAQHPTDESADGIRLAYDLSGPNASSAAVQKMLDTASADALYWSTTTLSEWADSAETAVRLARLLPGRHAVQAHFGDSTFQRSLLATQLAERGHLRESFRVWRDSPEVPWMGMAGGLPADTVNAVVKHWLIPATAQTPGQGCVACALPWFAFRRDTSGLRSVLVLLDRVTAGPTPAVPPTVATYARAWIRSLMQLARGDTAGALQAEAALPDSLCSGCRNQVDGLLAQLFISTGQYRAAEPLVNQWRGGLAVQFVLQELQRARVAERLGNRDQAVASYARVAATWVAADSALQPLVTEARTALTRLGGDRSKAVRF
ncbi:MAG TPA: serine/threonine-protein kinase [Gemmatimonadaceae bacterium]